MADMKNAALAELARRELANRGVDVSTDKLKEYKNENVGDIFNNIFVRPGAGVRSAIKGQGFQEGFADPNSTTTFQQDALDRFAPKTSSTLLNFLGGMPASTAGLAADIATNPADLLGLLIGKAPVGGGYTLGEKTLVAANNASKSITGESINSVLNANRSAKLLGREVAPGSVDRLGSMQASARGRAEVSRLLPAADLATDMKAGRPSGVQAEGLNLIKKTKNPMDVLNKFSLEKDKVISQVNELVAQNNKPVEPKFIASRVKLILAKQMKNSSPADRAKISKAVQSEIGFINEQPMFDTVTANARKRFLYEETQGLQNKQMAGKTIVVQPESMIVKDAFAQAYKEAIEGTHPEIANLNARFSGLDKGETAAAKFAESQVEKSSIVDRVVTQVAGRPSPQSAVAAAIRELPIIGTSTKKMTGNIEKFANKSADLLNKSRLKQADSLLERMLSNQDYYKSKFGVDDLLALTEAPPAEAIQKLLGRNLKSEVSRQLPPGVSTGKAAINADGPYKYQTINMPEVLESDKYRMAQKYGVPSYGDGPRSSTKNIPRVKNNLTKKQQEILNRRKKNFGG